MPTACSNFGIVQGENLFFPRALAVAGYLLQRRRRGHKLGERRMSLDRRDVLKFGAVAAANAIAGPLASIEVGAQGKPVVNLQLGWLLSGNQIGEVCAKALGYYEHEGIELRFQAGGPNIDGVAVVAA